jgi:hypothetical protein
MANKRTGLVLHQGGTGGGSGGSRESSSSSGGDGPKDPGDPTPRDVGKPGDPVPGDSDPVPVPGDPTPRDGDPTPGPRRKRPRATGKEGKDGKDGKRPPPPITVTVDDLREGLLERPRGPVSCAECHGPIFLCQGLHDPEEGSVGPEVLRAVTALRAAYMGLLLSPVAPMEQIAATLLLAARASLLGSDGRSIGYASMIADPQSSTVSATDAARMVCTMLLPEKIDGRVGKTLYKLLGNSKAKYLEDAIGVSFRAAQTSPVMQRGTFDLVALVCAGCAARMGAESDGWDRLAAADTFDHAVTCPVCHGDHVHPFGYGVRRIHPVSRCWGNDEAGCCVHGGGEMTQGLCAKGRAMYEGAFAKIGAHLGSANRASATSASGPNGAETGERRLVEALLRAKKHEEIDAANAANEKLRDVEPLEPFLNQIGRTFNAWMEGTLGLVPNASAPPAGPKLLGAKTRRPRGRTSGHTSGRTSGRTSGPAD